METRKISWIDRNFDTKLDESSAVIEEEWGNKGLGGIVAGLCGLAILLPTFFTVKQILEGTAKGNPIGAIIAVCLFLGWPVYWGLNQFFQKRFYEISDGIARFTLVSMIGRKKKWEVSIEDYKQIEFGWQRDVALYGPAIRRSSGNYFVRLKLEDRINSIVLYERVGEQMSQDRMEKYSSMFSLPLVDVAPGHTEKDAAFKDRLESFKENRKQS